MPDLSRSYWRKIVCKNITEDMNGMLSCGLQPGCPLSLVPQEGCFPCALHHAPSRELLTSQLRILFHRIWNSTSPRRALPSFWGAEGQGGQSSQERGCCKGKATRSQPHEARKRWTHLACPVFPPNFPSTLQHQQNRSQQPSKESITLELAVMPLPGSSCAAAVGSTLLCCPWTKAGLACSRKECCRARLEKGSEVLLA